MVWKTNPFWQICASEISNSSSPKFRGDNKNCLSCHHLDIYYIPFAWKMVNDEPVGDNPHLCLRPTLLVKMRTIFRPEFTMCRTGKNRVGVTKWTPKSLQKQIVGKLPEDQRFFAGWGETSWNINCGETFFWTEENESMNEIFRILSAEFPLPSWFSRAYLEGNWFKHEWTIRCWEITCSAKFTVHFNLQKTLQ